jgi:hypothetical protein
VLGSAVLVMDVVRRAALAVARPQADAAAEVTAESEPVGIVVVSGGSFHVEACSLVAGVKRKTRKPIDDALAAGLMPCGLCLRPLDTA